MFHIRRFGLGIVLLAMTGLNVSQAKDARAVLNTAPAPDTQAAATLTLSAAVDEALAKNPGLSGMQAHAAAKSVVPNQVGTLPDPRLSLSLANFPWDSFERDEDPMTQIKFGLSQDMPFPGKLGLRKDAATFEAAAATTDSDEYRLGLARDVKRAWWRLFFLDRAMETVGRNQTLLRQLVTTARTKYTVGQGLQQDVLLAQLELSKLLDEEIRLKNARREQEALLNTLLDRPAQAPVALPQTADTQLPRVVSGTRLETMAIQNRPVLRAHESRVEAARVRRDLAKKDYYPDFRVGAVYGQRDGRKDLASLQFSMNLPIHASTKQKQAVDQRSSELMRGRHTLRDTQSRVASQVAVALARFERARDQVALFETGIIPQARQTVESMLAGYQVNKVDFLNLVRSQTTLYNYETQFWQAFSAANQALAELKAAVGEEKIYE